MSEEPKKPFIPSELDDAGLPANQFRILCHLWRRGETFSSAGTIAKICRLKRDKVFEILSDLEKAGFILRTPRPGQTTLIQPAPFWGTGIKTNPPRFGGREVPGFGGQDPPRFGGHKGNPIKETPLRKSQGGRKSETVIPLPFTSDEFGEAWNDWQQHRREIKKKLTPKSIEKQFMALAAMGESNAIAAIDHSIGKGWTGIFPATSATTTSKPKPQKADDYKL